MNSAKTTLDGIIPNGTVNNDGFRDKPRPLESSNTQTMKATICTKYGSPDVLQFTEVPKPTPGENEILVKVHAASVTAADGMIRKGTPFYGRFFIGLMKPKMPIPGTGFAGVIESVGKNVTQYKEGDRVFGETGPGIQCPSRVRLCCRRKRAENHADQPVL